MADQTVNQRDDDAPKTAAPVKNTVDLDGISLEQTLRDFEIANARVIDLTKRLTALNREFVAASSQLQKLKLANKALSEELSAIKGSMAYKSANGAARIYRGAKQRLSR